MKIYLLRHEERDKNNVFFRGSLNQEGVRRANEELKEFIRFIDPKYIYCSPFIRAMQTIMPYLRSYKKNGTINADYGIAEALISPLFSNPYNQNFLLKREEEIRYYVNTNYISSVDPNSYKYVGKEHEEEALEKRVLHFIQKLNANHHDNETIMICSHQSTLNMFIRKYFGIEREMGADFGMGKVGYVENNQVLFLN
tara:strand:+ start:367 stop:957 length:591 start_codon:yes stop_codon:yes gene_type:complete